MKRLVSIILISLLLSSSFVFAEGDTVIIQEAENVNVGNAEELNVETEDVVVNADTVTINIKDGARLINGTVIRNLNLIVDDVSYKPTIDLSREIANILKTDDYKFGTVAVNEYLLKGDLVYQNGSSSIYDNSDTDTSLVLDNARYILGGDITKSKEELLPVGVPAAYEYDKFEYKSTEIFTPRLIPGTEEVASYATKEDAVMMVYKAVGQSQFKHYMYHNKYLRYNNPKYVEIGKSPFMELVPDVFAGITADRYYTYVYSTRTLPNAYWANAVSDKIVFEDDDRSSPVSLGEFAQLLYDKLEREGEPVLTEEEVEMMLVAHGRKLPLYLETGELEAIKHLMARGIADTDMDFQSLYMREEDALSMLSRAKSPDKRLTFKNVEYTYLPEVVKAGFYPTEMQNVTPQIESFRFTPTSVTDNINYYDYFIYSDKVNFTSASGKLETKIFVKNGDSALQGVTIQGAVMFGQRYYWLRVPITAENTAAVSLSLPDATGVITPKKYFVMDSISPSDSPDKLYLEVGGGVYGNMGVSGSYHYSLREPFTGNYDFDLYFDEERVSQLKKVSMVRTVYGATSGQVREYNFTFQSSNVSNLRWDGRPLTEYVDKDKYPYYEVVDVTTNTYNIKVKVSNPESYVLRYLTYGTQVDSTDMVKAYVSDSKVALVSSKWLMKTGLITGIVEIEEGARYLIYSKYDNTIIDMSDQSKRFIVSGQVVTEVAKDDKSPLVVKDPVTGEYLIDYRAVVNFSGNYMVINDDNGNISLTISDDPRSNLGNLYNKTDSSYRRAVYDLFGNGSFAAETLQDLNIPEVARQTGISLSDSYITANWLVYRQRSGGQYSDSLLVFRPSTHELKSKISVSNQAKLEREGINNIIKSYGIQMESYADLAVFSLNDWIFQTAADSALKKPGESWGLIVDKYTNKYYYIPPKANTYEELVAIYDDYMSASMYSEEVQRIKYAIPIVEYKGIMINMNNNLYLQNGEVADLKDYPSVLLNDRLKSFTTLDLDDKIVGTSPPDATDFLLAFAGVQAMYYPYESIPWSSATNDVIYLGSMLADVEYDASANGGQYGVYTLKVSGQTLHTMADYGGISSAPFNEIFRGSQSTVLSYGLDTRFRLVNPTSTVNWDSKGFAKSLVEATGDVLSLDLDEFRFKEFLYWTDDVLSVIHFMTLSIIPRLMLFMFVIFMTLALAVDNPLLRKFADKIFDPFKIISLGYTDITHVTTKNAWITSFIAIVFLSMTATTLTSVIAWLMKFFQVLLSYR